MFWENNEEYWHVLLFWVCPAHGYNSIYIEQSFDHFRDVPNYHIYIGYVYLSSYQAVYQNLSIYSWNIASKCFSLLHLCFLDFVRVLLTGKQVFLYTSGEFASVFLSRNVFKLVRFMYCKSMKDFLVMLFTGNTGTFMCI